MKLAKTGWPPSVRTQEQRAAFFAEIQKTMGITLTEDEVENNPALRSVSKLLLNTVSLKSCYIFLSYQLKAWGKFAQNPNVKNTEFVDGDTFAHYMDTRKEQMSTYRQLGPDSFLVTFNVVTEEVHSSNYGNLPLAIFITSHARLRLYSMLQASNGTALYNDTGFFLLLN